MDAEHAKVRSEFDLGNHNSISSPLADATTALLRTLQSEQLSIRVRYFVYDDLDGLVADKMGHAALVDLNDASGEL